MTSPDQNDPLAVYYAEVLAATNRFYASLAALKEHQAGQAQAPGAEPRQADTEQHTPDETARPRRTP